MIEIKLSNFAASIWVVIIILTVAFLGYFVARSEGSDRQLQHELKRLQALSVAYDEAIKPKPVVEK